MWCLERLVLFGSYLYIYSELLNIDRPIIAAYILDFKQFQVAYEHGASYSLPSSMQSWKDLLGGI